MANARALMGMPARRVRLLAAPKAARGTASASPTARANASLATRARHVRTGRAHTSRIAMGMASVSTALALARRVGVALHAMCVLARVIAVATARATAPLARVLALMDGAAPLVPNHRRASQTARGAAYARAACALARRGRAASRVSCSAVRPAALAAACAIVREASASASTATPGRTAEHARAGAAVAPTASAPMGSAPASGAGLARAARSGSASPTARSRQACVIALRVSAPARKASEVETALEECALRPGVTAMAPARAASACAGRGGEVRGATSATCACVAAAGPLAAVAMIRPLGALAFLASGGLTARSTCAMPAAAAARMATAILGWASACARWGGPAAGATSSSARRRARARASVSMAPAVAMLDVSATRAIVRRARTRRAPGTARACVGSASATAASLAGHATCSAAPAIRRAPALEDALRTQSTAAARSRAPLRVSAQPRWALAVWLAWRGASVRRGMAVRRARNSHARSGHPPAATVPARAVGQAWLLLPTTRLTWTA